MRFGQQFLSSQLPGWELHYLPYRQLKALLKLTPSDGTGDLLTGTLAASSVDV